MYKRNRPTTDRRAAFSALPLCCARGFVRAPQAPTLRNPPLRQAQGGHSVLRNSLVVVLLVAAALGGCGLPGEFEPADSLEIDFAVPADPNPHGAIVFIVDGLNARIFQEMLDAGELPAIREYFVDRGLYIPRAVGSVPSVTLTSLTSLATGVFPGHHGVMGINWFGRNQLVWRNYETIAQKNLVDPDHNVPLLYEYFPHRTTFSLFFQPHRGATKFFENWTSAGPAYFFGMYELMDRLALWRMAQAMDLARVRGEFPGLMIAYTLAPDFRAYEEGVLSEAYRTAVRHIDRQVGRVLGDLERAGLLDDIVIALVSDHGHTEVERHFPINAFLREGLGLRVAEKELWEKTPFEDRLDYYREFPIVTYGSGDRYWALCLRRPVHGADGRIVGYRPWPERPTLEELQRYPGSGPDLRGRKPADTGTLLEVLARLPAVDALAYAAGPDRVRVRRKGGVVEFAQEGGRHAPITYRVIEGTDPLGWEGSVEPPALAGDPRDERWWFEATACTQYPDLPAQILAYFRSDRAGDIALFAAPGWDFGTKWKSGHGGLGPVDMHVPLLLAGPGVPQGIRPPARAIDLVPTLLRLLDAPLPDDLDGRPLFDVPPSPAQ